MRTDPSADEVRGIVNRIFEGFFRKKRAKTGLNARCAGLSPSSTSREGCARPRFPRLYEAPQDDRDEPLVLQIAETIVIDRGRYVARSYRTEGFLAMWLVAAGLVQFYDGTGRMLATINLFESLRPQRMAA
jgi:hypothetical protein